MSSPWTARDRTIIGTLAPLPSLPSNTTTGTATAPIVFKDPLRFLHMCSGFTHGTGVRCNKVIKEYWHHMKSRPRYLPTCQEHKNQRILAGWCQFLQKNGESCGRLFRWIRPSPELCSEHRDPPCYFLKLPVELRLIIFRYLLPSEPIGSSTALVHAKDENERPGFNDLYAPPPCQASTMRRDENSTPYQQTTTASLFGTPFLNLVLVNRQVYAEVKDLLFSTVSFTVDVRRDGAYMCGRRLLAPTRADGTSHSNTESTDCLKTNFIKSFDWAAVKHYNVDILVENWKEEAHLSECSWDEEVELYDIRDYIGVVVSRFLCKSRKLYQLNVRLAISKFDWNDEELLANVRTLFGPFERLRNVTKPHISGVFLGTPQVNVMVALPLPTVTGNPLPARCTPPTPICSVPPLPAETLVPIWENQAFCVYRWEWQRQITEVSSSSLRPQPPIYAMFNKFREFYTRLAALCPDVIRRGGKTAFLHRARVAREQENVVEFTALREELIKHWCAYMEQEKIKKEGINICLARLHEADVDPPSGSGSKSSAPDSNAQPSIVLDAHALNRERRVFPLGDGTLDVLLLRQGQQGQDESIHYDWQPGCWLMRHTDNPAPYMTGHVDLAQQAAQQQQSTSIPGAALSQTGSMSLIPEQQNWQPAQYSIVNYDGMSETFASASASSSSSSSSSANLSLATYFTSNQFTPPPTQQVQSDGFWHNQVLPDYSFTQDTSSANMDFTVPAYMDLTNDLSNAPPNFAYPPDSAVGPSQPYAPPQTGFIENGDQIMSNNDDFIDVFREWAGQSNQAVPSQVVGKGKGKVKYAATGSDPWGTEWMEADNMGPWP
ncbi:hypothetical protein K458DRAFT_324752 [Lentithecium fluviatile CBS 122367]|uniref:F-box domain-containing protein n=1 Tax=Lentithecium fluviatile CBS 122367 TaxID=1168545 RepID=A0A6G1JMS5_9PLEO|nr:hypothetical protein K458DRAFT_324752 [Lentithecium fluviatile CBS 122367]